MGSAAASIIYNGQEVAWLDLSVRIFGYKVIGLRGIKYAIETEKELLYGAGNVPIGIQTGNVKPDGSVKMLKNDYDKLNDAAVAAGYTDLTQVPYQAIVITANYKIAFGRPMRTDTLAGVAFSKFEKSMDQNAKMMEIELPFVYLQLSQN